MKIKYLFLLSFLALTGCQTSKHYNPTDGQPKLPGGATFAVEVQSQDVNEQQGMA